MAQFMKKAFGGLRKAADSLLESADDPRTVQPDVREPHMDSLKQVQDARFEVDMALDRLKGLSDKAHESLESFESQANEGDVTSQRFAAELVREIQGEITSIERQEEHLRKQQEVLLMSERRLIASIRKGAVTRQLAGATSASSQAKEAADSALQDVGTDMRRLDAVINRARVATERLEDRSRLIDQKVRRGTHAEPLSKQDRLSHATVAVGFDDIATSEANPELCRLADQGKAAMENLTTAYQQLELAIERHRSNPATPDSELAIRAARAYRRGLRVAEIALEKLTDLTFSSCATDVVSATDQRSVAERLAIVGQIETSIYQARLELIAVANGDPEATTEAIFDALRPDLEPVSGAQNLHDELI